MTRQRPVVAIDGPAGAGKSTVAQRLADRLGYVRVDTGALYRSVAWQVLELRIDPSDSSAVTQVAEELAEPGALAFVPGPSECDVVLFGQSIGAAIRNQDVGVAASVVSQIPGVRDALFEMQRSLGAEGGVVLEGRDIGTVVFPDAEVKFFLTASVRVRATRRQRELLGRGSEVPLAEVESEVSERDRRDSTRALAPLRKADDAIVVDSSELTIDEVIEQMAVFVREVEQRLMKA